MPEILPTQYFVADQPEPIIPGNPLWEKPLPLDYRPSKKIPQTSLTYGAYFRAISDYIGKLGSTHLAGIASQLAGRPVSAGDISHLDIHLEKHGAFYHPARLILHVNADCIACVVNVAVSPLGMETIKAEFDNLKRLSARYATHWLPFVFNCKAVAIHEQQDVQVFMGEWFADFHEFHLSEAKATKNLAIRVWDPENPDHYLSSNQVQQIITQAAMILTAHYRLDTTEQIASWHNAAGDFVVCVETEVINVKLITVRGYEPLFNLDQADVSLETILNTVLIFFLNISMKMRIDRLDGVGDMVWNSLNVVPSIIAGFFEGLEFQAKHQRIPLELIDAIKIFFFNLPAKDVQDICAEIIGRIEPQSPDLSAVKAGINAHIAAIMSGFRQL